MSSYVAKGVGEDLQIRDKRRGVVLSSACKCAGGTYVDNIAILPTSKHHCNRTMQRVIETMQNDGLVVHEVEPASTTAKFIGLELHHNTFYIKRVKMWRVRKALRFVLKRGFISGVALEVLLGHITWLMMVRREALAILCACYDVVREHYRVHVPLSEDVRQELFQVSSLLPLLSSSVAAEWSEDLYCSDASPSGLVCVTPETAPA